MKPLLEYMMSETPVARFDQGHCSAVVYPDVVEYVFHRADKVAVDALIELFNQVVALRYPNGYTGIVRIVYDTREAGPPPFFWLFTRGQQWRQQHPTYQPSEVRMALIYASTHRFHEAFLMRLVEQFHTLFSHQTHRFGLFEEDRAAALEWLRAEDAPDHLRDTVVRSF